jgi:enoyl-[acyl-carrier protein] reductase II
MFKTRVTELLGIEFPIFQGGMAHVAQPELAAAVSNAGGLGTLAAGNYPPQKLREMVHKLRDLTDKPFAINIYLLTDEIPAKVDAMAEEQVPVVVFGAGNPGKYIPGLKEAGVKVIPVVAAGSLAKRLVRYGADAVIVEGMEAGGHIGEVTSMVLTPCIVNAVEVPVIAAGGIADGRGMAAALCLGAEGVQLGTRFAVTVESPMHERFKQAIIKASERDTVVTGHGLGHPVRAIGNQLTREFDRLEKEGATAEEMEALGIGSLAKAVWEGDIDRGSLMAGQSAGLITELMTCREVMEKLSTEAEEVLKRVCKFTQNC